jgi:CubicO group peptidase (beta-lactamase class C family)
VGVAVINDWKVEWARGYGAATRDTLFQAASVSKPVTALAVMRLVEEGKLDLDQNVNQRLVGWKVAENEFTKKEKVTLRRLLSHSAGLAVHGFPGYVRGEQVPTLVQVLNGKEPANTDPVQVDLVPGSRWRYSGGGYCVVQKLLVDVTGKKFPTLMRELVLDRLGMKDSTYEQPLPQKLENRAATGLLITGIPMEGKWHTYPEMAAAGLWTTPEDLARFVVELLKPGRVLSKETTRKMLTVVKGGYGLGISVQGKGESLLISHGGNNAGFSCFLVGFTRTGQGAVVMTNSDAGNPVIQEILQRLAKEYGWPSK